ncbi:nif11-like leader peptide domain protein [Synechococcus sp. BIOS-E4-1]|uniref:Nif11-like leader peptide family RiPP precursor n=1 Tax=Synechococcus sp. BIOS-E4-1 TaxID=1400864 RepID=UPI0016465947|nr:Nif11-like leader peptide family RiPP precursor [Synechococcus sp. BIOS-E4-1]QNI54911.1 nif11-like leader peptide domain protein [Synechococcus sp. BIOS-E4-1]
MPEEQLKTFLEKIKENKSLLERLKAAESSDEIKAIAREYGHEIGNDQVEMLSGQQLESLSGSGGTCAIGPNTLACTE